MNNLRLHYSFWLILSLLLASGCNRTLLPECENFEFPLASDWDELGFFDNIESYDVIKLEAVEEATIGTIDKVVFYDGNLYVLDKKRRRIVIFDNQGTYVSKIDRVGRGPGEYLQIDDFDIHDGKVYLLAWGKVQRCSLSGEYESTVLSDREATMIHITDAGHIMLVGSDLSDECLVHEYDFDGNLIHGYLEVDKAFKEVLFRTDSGWGFSKCDGRLYFSVPMLETIYELNDGKATPVFTFLTERSPAKFLAQDVPGNPDGMNYDMRLNKFWGKLDDNYCCPYKKMVSTRYYTCYGRNKHSRVVFLYDRHSKTGIGGESVASYLMDMMFYDSSSQISDDTFAVDMSSFTGDELISMRAFAKLQGEQINIDVFNRLCQFGKSENSNPCLLIFTLK